jgi:hypothetical protein
LETTVTTVCKVEERAWRNECVGRNVLRVWYRPTSDKGLNGSEVLKYILNKLSERRWTTLKWIGGGRNEEVLLTLK